MGYQRFQFYAVANGRVPGIYNDWKKARSQVQGFPNAVYKGFNVREEAEQFMKDHHLPGKFKYYAVKTGNKPGIYTNYEEAKKSWEGFEKAKYKGFNNLIEAIKFMEIEKMDGDFIIQIKLNNAKKPIVQTATKRSSEVDDVDDEMKKLKL